jgi:hypothetical protein
MECSFGNILGGETLTFFIATHKNENYDFFIDWIKKKKKQSKLHLLMDIVI